MRNITLLGSTATLSLGLMLSACGGASSPDPVAQMPMPGPAPTAITGATPATLLSLAGTPTETADALAVGTDSVAAADLNDEISDPLPAT